MSEGEGDEGWDDPDENGGGWPDPEEKEQDDDVGVQIENLKYEGEQFFRVNKAEALSKYEKVVELESTHNLNENTFMSLEMIAILSGELGDFAKQKLTIQKLLVKSDTAGRNQVEDAITNIIESAHRLSDKNQAELITRQILDYLKNKNRNLWLQSCINLGGIHLGN